MRKIFQLALVLLCLSCQPPSPVMPEDSQLLPPPGGPVLLDIGGTAVSEGSRDHLAFKIVTKRFHTQGLDLARIKYLRIWVRGTGISAQMWNQEGYVRFDNQAALTVAGIPKGRNRIVTAQGYDGDKNPLAEAVLKAVYTSPPGDSQVTVTLKWRFMPLGKALEHLLDADPQMAEKVDAIASQQALEQIMYQNPADAATLKVHPGLVDPLQVAALLQQGQGKIADAQQAAQAVKPSGSATVVVQAPGGIIFNQPIELLLDDPFSSAVSIPAGSDRAVLSQIPAGTWNLRARMNTPAGVRELAGTLGVDVNGNVTLNAGSGANPLVFPPLLTSLDGPWPMPAVPNLAAWWGGEDNANDLQANNEGSLINGTGFTQGMVGQAFNFDGVNDYVEVPHDPSLDFSSAMTAEAWVFLTGGSARKTLVTKSGTWSSGTGFWFFVEGNFLFLNVFGCCIHTLQFDAGPGLYNRWHHVATTFDENAGGLAKLYIDGALKATAVTGHTLDSNTNPVWLGRRGDAAEFMQGRLDEVRLYNRALSDAEILSQYQTRSVRLNGGGFSPNPANNDVRFAAQAAPAASVTSTRMEVSLLPAITGTLPVTVTTGGLTSNPLNFTMPPFVASVSQTQVLPGNVVTIAGAGFDPVPANNTVRMNGLAAAVNAATTTTLSATVPAGFTPGPLTVTNGGGTANGPALTLLPAELIGWWQGENNAQDQAGTNHGVLNGNTAYASGKTGQAFSLDGAGDFIQAPASPALRPARLTLAAWIRPASFRAGSWDTVIAHGNTGADPILGCCLDSYYLGLFDGRPHFYTGHNTGGHAQTGPAQVTLNQWYHLVGTFDETTKNIYLNGTLVATTSLANPIRYEAVPLLIGDDWNNGAPAGISFNGLIDEVRIYNRALNAAEVLAVYNGG